MLPIIAVVAQWPYAGVAQLARRHPLKGVVWDHASDRKSTEGFWRALHEYVNFGRYGAVLFFWTMYKIYIFMQKKLIRILARTA